MLSLKDLLFLLFFIFECFHWLILLNQISQIVKRNIVSWTSSTKLLEVRNFYARFIVMYVTLVSWDVEWSHPFILKELMNYLNSLWSSYLRVTWMCLWFAYLYPLLWVQFWNYASRYIKHAHDCPSDRVPLYDVKKLNWPLQIVYGMILLKLFL